MLTWTRWGLHTVATGGNLIGAAESGVNVRTIKIGNFVLANLLAGFAGHPRLDPDHDDRAAAGRPGPDVPRRRGRGDRRHVALRWLRLGASARFIGVAVLVILRTGFNIIGVSAFTFDLIIGIAIIASMIVNVQVARLRNLGKLQ